MTNYNVFEAHASEMSPLPFIFSRYTLTANTPPAPGNWHENIELLYAAYGNGYVSCGGCKYPFECGDIFAVNSKEVHFVGCDDYLDYCCLIPDREFCMYNGMDTSRIKFEHIIKSDAAVCLFNKLANDYSRSQLYRGTALRCEVLSLLVYIAENYSTPNLGGVSDLSNMGISLAIGYIQANFDQKLTVDELANQSGLSKFYFIREFAKTTGCTPIEYINLIRCQTARKLLSSGSYRIREVSEKCGFENMSYFAKLFKRYIGKTPTEFLKTNSKTPAR